MDPHGAPAVTTLDRGSKYFEVFGPPVQIFQRSIRTPSEVICGIRPLIVISPLSSSMSNLELEAIEYVIVLPVPSSASLASTTPTMRSKGERSLLSADHEKS